VPWRPSSRTAGDDLDALVRCAGIGAVGAYRGARRAVGDELDDVVHAAGAWYGAAARHRRAALRGWASRRHGVAGLDPASVPPPTGVFVGGHPYAHRQRAIRRMLRNV
jgi:hypothetical protein